LTPPAAAATLPPLTLRLYIASESPNSVAATKNLYAALARHPALQVNLEVVDLLRDPERGIRDGVMFTPMLVRSEPTPERRLLGSLGNRSALLSLLGVEESAP